MNAIYGLVFLLANGDNDWGHMDWDGGWWIVMMIGMILFWGLVILGIVWLVRELSDRGRTRTVHAPDAPDPLETLDRRLAEGDISIEEYEERRRVLRGSG